MTLSAAHRPAAVPAARATTLLPAAALLLIGVGLALSLFPADLLAGGADWWGRLSGDDAVGLIGSRYFALDAWRFPLFRTAMLGPPEGVNIIFTDAVPGMALLGKLAHRLTGTAPNYLGGWLLLAYAAQPLAAYALLRAMGVRRVLAFPGGILALLMPAFVFRYGHIGLVAHFVILLAFLAYARAVTVATAREIAASAVLAALVLLINPYLLAMAGGIVAAGVVEAARRGRIGPLRGVGILALMAGTAVGLAALFGVLDRDGTATGGFGLYSMNLLSPVVPQLSALPGHGAYILDATQGQYEGYNYLGAGILLLLLLAVVTGWRLVLGLLARHAVLVAAVGAMAVYALSGEVYAGGRLLARLPFYETLEPFRTLAATFRSSGRFFWPAGYLALAGAVLVLARRLPPARCLGLMAAAVALQLVDTRPLLRSVEARAAASPEPFDRGLWAAALSRHDGLVILPEFLCTHPGNRRYIYPLQVMASAAGIPSNSPIINRGQRDCAGAQLGLMRRVDAAAVTANPLLVLFKDSVPAVLAQMAQHQGFACRDAGFALACSRRTDDPAVRALGADPAAATPLPLGTRLSALKDGDGLPFLGAGWSVADNHFRWGEGEAAIITGRLAAPVCGGLTFRALVVPLAFGDHIVGTAQVLLNGVPAGTLSVSGSGLQEVRMAFPPAAGCLDAATVELRFDGLKSPHELGMNQDVRRLTWAMQWFELAAP